MKDGTKGYLKSATSLPKWAQTSLAVAVALPPYWFIRNPSEVIKTRLQVGAEGYGNMSTIDGFKLALSKSNSTTDALNELYQGFSENILYGFPADIIKFVAYDYLTGGNGKKVKKVEPLAGAVFGAMATGIAQLLTTPLDVVRNRIMADSMDNLTCQEANYLDRVAKIAREEGVQELFAGSSPRLAKAVLSGAIQFATYEETKAKMDIIFSSSTRPK